MTTLTRKGGAPTPQTPFMDARSVIIGPNSGNANQFPCFGPNEPLAGGGTIQLLGNALPVGGGASAVRVRDGLINAVQLTVGPLGADIVSYPSGQMLAPLYAGQGIWPADTPTIRVGFRVRRTAIGGNDGHNSGLIMGWDQADVNALPAPPLMRFGCFGIVGDSAGGWAFVASNAVAEITNQVLVWPVVTTDYCDAELRIVPGNDSSPGAVEVWIGGRRQLSYPIGGPNLPPVVATAGNFGLFMSLYHLVNGAVSVPLRISNYWAGTI